MYQVAGLPPFDNTIMLEYLQREGADYIQSLIGALSVDGLIATMSVKGSVDRDVFLTYLNHVLLPQLWSGAIVIMDNLKVHHATAVRAAIEAVGARLVFLPPYLPDLSPIEPKLVETQTVLTLSICSYL